MYFKLFILSLIYEIHIAECGWKSHRPNVVFIMIDDLGWNDVSFHGSPEITTPNMDALAATGITLQKYYSAPLCTPSRGSLMSGKYATHLGLQRYVILPGAPFGLPTSEKLLPEYLKELGYDTHGIGKWHLGAHKREFLPTNRGFDSFFGHWFHGIDYYDHTVYQPSLPNSSLAEILGLDLHEGEYIAKGYQGQYITDLYTDKALSIIKSHNQSKPLFLFVAHQAVHHANLYQQYQAPFDYVEKFNYIKDINRRIFAGMISKADESIGKIFEGLFEADMLGNTIIILSSDNGASTREFYYGGAGSNWPLRGFKGQTFEGGVRIPGLIWSTLLYPNIPKISNQLIHISDWLPTLYAAAGGNVEKLGDIDGVNMWDHFLYNKPSPRHEILLNIDTISGEAALIRGDFKIIVGLSEDKNNSWYGPSGREVLDFASSDEWVWKDGSIVKSILEGINKWPRKNLDAWRSSLVINCGTESPDAFGDITQPQIFNLADDPCEYNNLAEVRPDILASLRARLEMYNASAMEALFQNVDIHSDPRCFNFAFVPWMDEDYKSSCPNL